MPAIRNGTVAKVEVTKRTATNNVAEVTVTDTDGKKVTLTRSSVRTVFGLKSINYSITANTAATSSADKNRCAENRIRDKDER